MLEKELKEVWGLVLGGKRVVEEGGGSVFVREREMEAGGMGGWNLEFGTRDFTVSFFYFIFLSKISNLVTQPLNCGKVKLSINL